jgi:hypothetical protein
MQDKLEKGFSLINPFELLGFDSKNPNISMKDLKNTYYQLALICHPDKGGNSDDMLILQNAYLYIKKQIELKDEKATSFDIIEQEFKNFMEEQKKTPPPFSQVYEEAHLWLSDFNKKFENQNFNFDLQEYQNYLINKFQNENFKFDPNGYPNYLKEKFKIDNQHFQPLITDGYGDMMDQSLVKNIVESNIDRDEELVNKPTYEFTSDIIEYTDPRSFNFNQSNGYDISGKKKSDYTQTMGALTLSDYKQALTSHKITSLESESVSNKGNVENELEKLLQQREEMDLYISKMVYSKTYIPPPEDTFN